MTNSRSLLKWLAAAACAALAGAFLISPRGSERAVETAEATGPASAQPEADSSSDAALTSAANAPAGNTQQTQKPEAPAEDDELVGTWEQQVLSAPGMLETLGTFAVTKSNGAYAMSAIEQSKASGVINSAGITNVLLKGDQWTFNSDWGGGRIAEFRLRRVNAKLFEGYAYFNGEVYSALNRWVKIR